MSDHGTDPEFPIFPLPSVVLFPGAYLPLHTFEPRYRAMTRAALDGGKVIGMVLVKPGEDAMAPIAPVFDTGCAGTIIESRELDDGRFNLVLRGWRRFRISDEELAPEGYRCARVEWRPDADFESLEPELRAKLESRCELLQQNMLELAQLTAPQSVDVVRTRMRELDPLSLTHAIAFGLDCQPVEKQTLLECDDPAERLELLLGLVEFASASARLPGGSDSVN